MFSISKTLDELLEEVSVLDPLQWENDDGPKGWYAVADNSGIVAYFGKEEHALGFRMAMINATLNDLAAAS
jgi:hypothetical protein